MDSYMIFIREWLNAMKNLESKKEILSIYLGGSVARGDYKIGFSDIDIYIVTKYKNPSFDDIKTETQKVLNHYLPEMAWCPDFVTVAYESHENIISGQSWLGAGSEYFSFIETAKLLYGEDTKPEIRKPEYSDILKISNASLAQLAEIVRQDISVVPKDKVFYRGLIGTFFSALHFFLSLRGVFVRDKTAMMIKLSTDYPQYQEIANSMYKLWESDDFFDISDTKINHLAEQIKNFVIDVSK